ncbi:MAG: dienelactone hydrolase family protein [Chlamydiales bacterium]
MRTSFISYEHEGKILEAFVASPSDSARRPLVLLCHSWSGRDTYICEKAEMVARWGYVAFALDLYGKGVVGKSPDENAALKQPLLRDRQLLQKRLLTALDVASKLPNVDPNRIATFGFGFGGLCALDLARSGANLRGAASVYGHFEPSGLDKRLIKAHILLLHGMDDPIVPMSELLTFTKEMTEEGVDHQTHLFGNALHAFTNPQANALEKGMLYNPVAAGRAMLLIRNFLQEVFGEELYEE